MLLIILTLFLMRWMNLCRIVRLFQIILVHGIYGDSSALPNKGYLLAVGMGPACSERCGLPHFDLFLECCFK